MQKWISKELFIHSAKNGSSLPPLKENIDNKSTKAHVAIFSNEYLDF